MPVKRHASLSFIFVTLVLDVLGIGLIIPVAPKLVAQVMGYTEAEVAKASLASGALIATYAAMQFIFAPILGALSDRFGRRPVILVALLGSGLDYFAMALAPSLTWLFITRALNGISGASITACTAYIADVTPPEKRAAGFGLIGAAFGLGFVFGPLLGGWLGHYDLRLPFVVAGGLTLVAWLYGLLVLPESLPPEKRGKFSLAEASPVRALVGLSRRPVVNRLALTQFLVQMAQFSLQATWVLYTAAHYGWGTFEVGMSLAVVGLTAAAVQGGLARKLVPKLGEGRSLVIGLTIGTVAYACYALAPYGWMIYCIIAVASLGAIAQPAGTALVSKHTPPTEQGVVQGSLTALQAVAQILGALMGGALLKAFTAEGALVQFPGAPLMASSLLCLLGMLNAVAVVRGLRRAGAVGVKEADGAGGAAAGGSTSR